MQRRTQALFCSLVFSQLLLLVDPHFRPLSSLSFLSSSSSHLFLRPGVGCRCRGARLDLLVSPDFTLCCQGLSLASTSWAQHDSGHVCLSLGPRQLLDVG